MLPNACIIWKKRKAGPAGTPQQFNTNWQLGQIKKIVWFRLPDRP